MTALTTTSLGYTKHLVIGAGVVGLAVASALAKRGSTLLVDKNPRVGEETSSRNSEVIHAGLYYPPQSLKTQLCIRGKNLLYERCERVGRGVVDFKKIGKWVIAQNEGEMAYLNQMREKAKQLGVPLDFIPRSDINRLEPNLRAMEALHSPTTGIIDSHSLMTHLESDIIDNGGDLSLNTRVVSIERRKPNSAGGGYNVVVEIDGDGHHRQEARERYLIEADVIVNSAGLWADKVAAMLHSEWASKYKLHYCKGHYYGYMGKTIVGRLIYPVPEKNLVGLGVHVTLDLGNRTRFGPDTLYINSNQDYSIPEPESDDCKQRLDIAFNAARRYLPSLSRDQLYLDYSGIRPKLAGPGEPFRDFIIEEESESGYPGFVNLVGIESPGLTSSLAIAELVERKLGYQHQ